MGVNSSMWALKIFILATSLSLFFGLMSELLIGNAGFLVSIFVIIVFVFISVLTDIMGVAVTACSKEYVLNLVRKNQKGAKEALVLINNADKVSSLCADVLGDVCGILSGAAGASIVTKIVSSLNNVGFAIIISSLITAIIAGLTIFGKALGKRFAITKSNDIVIGLGRVLSVFVNFEKMK